LVMTDTDTNAPSCHDCGEPYGSPRFPDLILPHAMWEKISPSGDENGLLCPNCMCARAAGSGIEWRAVFRSGPFFDASGTHEAMNAKPDTIARRTADNERLQERLKLAYRLLSSILQEALSYNHHGYAKMAGEAIVELGADNIPTIVGKRRGALERLAGR
jgi:hypothetical protein